MPWAAAAAAIGGSLLSSRSGSKAAGASRAGQDRALQATLEAEQRAKAAAIPLFNASTKNALMGFQGALDLQGQTIPEQFRQFQQGNQQAQGTMKAGLDPQIAAILGGNVDLSGLQSQQIQAPDMAMFQQQLPQFQDMLTTLPEESARYIPGAWEEQQNRLAAAGGPNPYAQNPSNPYDRNAFQGYDQQPLQQNMDPMSALSGNFNLPASLGMFNYPIGYSGPQAYTGPQDAPAGMSPPKNFLGGY